MSGILKFLGVDSGFGRNNTSAYVLLGNRILLIDCGFTVYNKLQDKNFIDPKYDFDVIVTHLHPDHFGSLGQLVFTTYYNFKKTVNIISASKNLDSELAGCGTGFDMHRPNPTFPEVSYTRNNTYDVKFIEVPHVINMDCYGFVVQIGDRRVVYTGDTTTIEPFLEYVSPDTEFYVDASFTGGGGVHLNLKENLGILSDIASRSAGVFLMHMDNKEQIEELIKGTKIQMAVEEK